MRIVVDNMSHNVLIYMPPSEGVNKFRPKRVNKLKQI